MKIETIQISELKPYPTNPRKNDSAVDTVVMSIKEFGFKNPIIIDKNNEIIAGHTRLRAAKLLKMTEVPIIRVEDLTPEQVKAYRIMDNKSQELSQWDLEVLQTEMDELKGKGFDLELTGFDFDEVGQLINAEEAEPNYDFKEVDRTEFTNIFVKIGYLKGQISPETFDEFNRVYNKLIETHSTMDDVFKELIKCQQK